MRLHRTPAPWPARPVDATVAEDDDGHMHINFPDGDGDDSKGAAAEAGEGTRRWQSGWCSGGAGGRGACGAAPWIIIVIGERDGRHGGGRGGVGDLSGPSRRLVPLIT